MPKVSQLVVYPLGVVTIEGVAANQVNMT